MKENPYWIAPEGLPFIIAAALCTAGLGYFFGWKGMLIPGLACLFCIWFFRDPKRVAPAEVANAGEQIVSPADGTILDVLEVEEGRFLKRKVKRVSIFMSPLNVHVNRAPVTGNVIATKYNPGKFLGAYSDKASLDNEQNAIVMKTGSGLEVLFVQIAGFIARRIVCYAKPGDSLATGQRFGLIRFGSRVDVYVPLDSEIAVSSKQTVRAGETVLARVRRK